MPNRQRGEDHERQQRELGVVGEEDGHDAEEGEPVDDQGGHSSVTSWFKASMSLVSRLTVRPVGVRSW